MALPCASPPGEIEPLTRATAMPAGWRWRIPLQHRVGNGYVYSSAHLSDDEAAEAILAAVEGEPLAEPRVLRFRAGRRKRSWSRNVVAVGLASGFLEPLESTSIYLVQAAILQLIELFPIRAIEAADRDEFNRLIDYEYDRIRDFLILHYHASTRDDSAFWNQVRHMPIPDSLADKIALFRRAGRIERYSHGLFFEPSWIAVMIGQGVIPEGRDQRADAVDPRELGAALDRLRSQIASEVRRLPGHREALARLERR
jgi:tryptophan halogenase